LDDGIDHCDERPFFNDCYPTDISANFQPVLGDSGVSNGYRDKKKFNSLFLKGNIHASGYRFQDGAIFIEQAHQAALDHPSSIQHVRKNKL
jgi:hypothetical protein